MQKIDKNLSFKYRFYRYYPMIVLLIVIIFSIIIVIIPTILLKEPFFGVISVLFVVVFFANFLIYKKRARFYISTINATSENVEKNFMILMKRKL